MNASQNEYKHPVSWFLTDGMRLHKCFMSEKWCTFERTINNSLTLKNKPSSQEGISTTFIAKAFVIMPFSEPFDQIFNYQIRPMLSGINPQLAVSRADTIMRTGYVMCEKICKQIQEADLVVAEITQARENVLYELGLAAGLHRRILLMAQEKEDGSISDDARSIISKLNISDHRHSREYFQYVPFTYIMTTAEELFKRTWIPHASDRNCQTVAKVGVLTSGQAVYFNPFHRPANAASFQPLDPLSTSLVAFQLEDVLKCVLGNVNRDIILEYKGLPTEEQYESELQRLGNPTQEIRKPSESTQQDQEHSKQQIRDNILKQLDELIKANHLSEKDLEEVDPEIRWMVIDSRQTNNPNTSFEELVCFVEGCECIVIDASANANPINFFWLGYSHAKGKNVIPVTVHEAILGIPTVESPFDVRGLWHVYLETQRPETLKSQFFGIMKKIVLDNVEKRAKRAFWEPFLRDVKIQILVGANFKRAPNRYMVGEWDYMTLAELVGFLSQEKPTLDIQIASPVYQKSRAALDDLVKHSNDHQTTQDDKTLDDYLEAMIGGKNCILIASPDVNIVTEMVLAKAKDVCPFQSDLNEEGGFTGFVGYKSKLNEGEIANRRGFVHWQHRIFKEFSSRYNFNPTDSSVQDTMDTSSEKNEDVEYTFYNNVESRINKSKQLDELKKQGYKPLSEREVQRLDTRYEGLYGYMAIFENPYTRGKRILILSGISGPATMAMAQILTGCINSDVTINGLLCSLKEDERKRGDQLLKGLYKLNEEEKNQLNNKNEPERGDTISYGLLENRVKKIKVNDGAQADEKKSKDSSQEGGLLDDWVKTKDKEGTSKDKISENRNTEFTGLDYSLFSDRLLNELNKKIDSCQDVEALFYVVIGHLSQDNEEKTLEWKDPRRILLWGFANCAAEDPTLDNPKKFIAKIRDIRKEKQWPGKVEEIKNKSS